MAETPRAKVTVLLFSIGKETYTVSVLSLSLSPLTHDLFAFVKTYLALNGLSGCPVGCEKHMEEIEIQKDIGPSRLCDILTVF